MHNAPGTSVTAWSVEGQIAEAIKRGNPDKRQSISISEVMFVGEKIKVINGIVIRDITPEFTEEERKKRIKEVAEGLLALRKKDKTA